MDENNNNNPVNSSSSSSSRKVRGRLFRFLPSLRSRRTASKKSGMLAAAAAAATSGTSGLDTCREDYSSTSPAQSLGGEQHAVVTTTLNHNTNTKQHQQQHSPAPSLDEEEEEQIHSSRMNNVTLNNNNNNNKHHAVVRTTTGKTATTTTTTKAAVLTTPPSRNVLALSCLGIPLLVTDREGVIIEWNSELTKLTGWTLEQVMDRPIESFVSFNKQQQQQQQQQPLHAVIQNGLHRPGQCMFSLSTNNNNNNNNNSGVSIDFSANTIPLKQQEGADAVVFLLEEQKTQPSQKEHVSLQDLPSPVFAVSADQDDSNNEIVIITRWNTPMESLTGYTAAEVMGKTIDSLAMFNFSVSAKCLFRSSSQQENNGAIREKTALLTSKDKKRQVSVRLTWKRLGGSSDECLVVVHTTSIMEPSSSSSSDMMLLQDHLNVPIFSVDSQGLIQAWNKGARTASGYDASEAKGHLLADWCTTPSHRMPLHERLEQSRLENTNNNESSSSSEPFHLELEFQTKSGETRYWLAAVSPTTTTTNNGQSLFWMVALDVTESAQHDRAVASMALELRQLFDTANCPMFGVDLDGQINEWNDKMAELTGYSGDEAFTISSFLETFVPPEERHFVDNALQSAMKGRATSTLDLVIRTKCEYDNARSLYASISTRRNAENRIVGVLVVAQDVTELTRHEKAMTSVARELRLLIDTANAPIFGIDRDGDVNEWNEKMAEITGYSKQDAFDRPLVQTFITPYMQDSVQDVLDSALDGRSTSNLELEFRTKSDEIRHLLVNATTRRDAENNVVGAVAVAQDVTESVQRDRAVAGMAMELRQLIDTANAPIFGIDTDGNVNEWNRRTQEITGYSKEETFDEPLVERFIAPSMRQKVQEILDAALQGNETSNYELEFVSKSGEPRFLLVNATTRRDPEFNVVGVVGVAQDVTEDRKHAAELRKMHYVQVTQEAKVETERNMTAYFAHELRNPLGAIDSALNAMPENLPDSAKTLVAGMQLCSSFMSSIMNNLLDVRKMEEGKMELHKSPLSLTGLLFRVHSMLLPSVKPGVHFEYSTKTDGRDWVMGDEHRIQQVLTNVITNAIKYTLSGSVALSVCWEDNMVRFECSDTGPGIPIKEQERMFERFVQRGGAPGTGLGLAIAKHLVDLTGGNIKFMSDPSVRAGTTCVVRMPLHLCDAPDSVAAQDDSEDSGMIQEPLRFLIIDDVEMNRKMFKRRIKKSIAPNCILSEASTGEEALQTCGRETFDVIIVDQYMEEAGGVMVGTDVVYAMRRMRMDSIIIGCSGNDLDREFAEAGADWVWQKPVPPNEKIISHLRELLRVRRRGHT